MPRIVLILFLFFSSIYSFANDKEFFSPELAAKATAELLNRSGTFEGFIEQISPMLSTSEVEGVRSLFSEMKIQLNEPTPNFIAKGNTVLLNKQDLKITFNKNRTFNIAGRVFKAYQPGSFDLYLRKSHKDMSTPGSAVMRILLPQAEAFDIGSGIVSGIRVLMVGAAVGAVTVGTVAVYGGKEIYESVKNNTIECSGPYFKLRKKARGTMLLASSKENVLDPEKVNQVLGKQVTCNPETAAEVQKLIKLEPTKDLSPASAPVQPGSR